MTSDSNPKIPSEPEETSPQENTGSEPPKPTYTPASPTKRVLAWMGILYMLILLALNTFGLATGSALNGIAGLLLAPACLALAVIQGFKFRALRREGVPAHGSLAVAVLAALAGVYSLADGLFVLFAQLGG